MKDFQRCGKHLAFNKVIFSKLAAVKFRNNTVVSYRHVYGESAEVAVVDIKSKVATRKERANPLSISVQIPEPKTAQMQPLNAEKKKILPAC